LPLPLGSWMAAVIAPELLHDHDHDHNHNHAPQQAMGAPHGKKRAADTALDGEQRLSKRFDLLNLDTNKAARLYTAVPSHAPTPRPKRTRAPRPPTDDSMQVEDTPHRVYIHDLAAELSDTDSGSDSEHPIFLSDIEAHLSKIPRHVLLGPPPKPTAHNQMVLYNVPASLSVPEEQDNVRKAIVEARQRIREKQVSDLTEPERVLHAVGPGSVGAAEDGEGADAMDLD
jgi:hypothetical protein